MPLEVALDYTQTFKWSVFPCRSYDEVDQETGEVYAAKSPLTPNGLKSATLNERIVREWFGRRHTDALIGSPTGEAMGAWILDVDVKPGVGDGFEWVAEMEELHGKLPRTATVSTPRGGRHLYFKYHPGIRNRGELGPCIDVRGGGGFVVLAGSIMADGREYEWVDDTGPQDIVEAPQWLLDLVLPPAVTHQPAEPFSYVPGKNEPYIERAVEGELNRLASTGKGGRGHQLNASAFSLGQLVGAGALSRGEAEDGLFDAARACGVLQKDGDRETRAKIKRGLDAGMQQPRQIPDRQSDNDNTRLVDISRMIANGLAKAKTRTEKAPKETDTKTERSIQQQETEGFRITPFKWLDPSKLPRREFAYGSHYIRKYVSVTVSPGGLGKTSNSIAESLAMTSGKALLDVKPPSRMRVWLFNAEDPRDEMERRIMAACIHYNLKPEDIEGYLFLDTGREQELVIAQEDRKVGTKIVEPIVEAVAGHIKANSIDVMIVDPFVSTHKVNENDNGAIDTVAKLWAQIADRTNCAIDVVHHLKKVADREATVEDSRGAVSLIGAARSVRVLNRMTEEQATKAGISENERMSYFNIHQGKANLTKLSVAKDWRKMESVPLGNGRGLLKPQDHAGVVTAWSAPTNEEMAERVPEDVKRLVLVTLGNQDYRESPQSDQWAGYVLAEAMGIDVDVDRKMTPAKKQAKAILDAWLENGTLAVSKEDDPKHIGRKIKFIRPAPTTT